LVSLASRHLGRIVPSVRTKGSVYEENDEKYYKKLQQQVKMPEFGAIAEVLMYHAQKGQRAPEVAVYPDDERVQAALTAALAKDWPFVVHIEFAAAGPLKDEFMAQLEAMLSQNRGHPFVLIHIGQLEQSSVRRLSEAHGNVFFITSHSNPIVVQRSKQPWVDMFDGDVLSVEWKEVILDYPDRFILGIDNVWAEHWGQSYLDQVALWRKAMEELPLEVAHAFFHGNAERLWKLSPVA
jgi:predicted TIM-barrel fold metal-dependent hydrolase